MIRDSRGVTAIFIVIFSTLILSIIAVGFVSMMTREQSRSTDDELSESAYDSALAGVEDGKRVLAACDRDGPGSTACTAIDRRQCDTVQAAGIAGAAGQKEVPIQSDVSTTNQLNQAYTCVIVDKYTDSYVNDLEDNDATLIPLISEGAYNKVKLSWYTRDDITSGATTLSYPGSTTLTTVDAWGYDRHPPLLKVNLMQFDTTQSITPASFDNDGSAHTLYLYPRSVGVATASLGAADVRRSGGLAVTPVRCDTSVPAIVGYICSVTLDVPDLPGGVPAANRMAYLRLANFYGATHYQVQLYSDANPVNLVGVQPSIDATGRANDIFRRVAARVETTASDFPYPRATVDITNNFCKAFSVTVDMTVNEAACDAEISGN